MKVAVVCASEREAVDLAARLGMTQVARPLRAGHSMILGHRFTAVVITAKKEFRHRLWWEHLLTRTTGPVYVLEEWGTIRKDPE